MHMDEYELELLDAVENASRFERVENFEEEQKHQYPHSGV